MSDVAAVTIGVDFSESELALVIEALTISSGFKSSQPHYVRCTRLANRLREKQERVAALDAAAPSGG